MIVKNAISLFKVDKLKVEIYPDRLSMGRQAALAVSEKLKVLTSMQLNVRIVFAAAPSQNEFLSELASAKGINWSRVTAFHMDEYIGLNNNAEQKFGNFLKKRIFDKVNFKKVNYINSQSENPNRECKRYSELLNEAPIDIVCLGIGENGHIAFNDPAFADFNDTKTVKIVKLDDVSRQQQVNDGCFTSINEVPKEAITLTIPAMFSAKYLFTVVPGSTKKTAVYKTLYGKINSDCPATILRKHDNAVLYLDSQSASKIY